MSKFSDVNYENGTAIFQPSQDSREIHRNFKIYHNIQRPSATMILSSPENLFKRV